jgi:hypothetical protein
MMKIRYLIIYIFASNVCHAQNEHNLYIGGQNMSGYTCKKDTSELSKTAILVLNAYGGIEFWQDLKTIEAEVSAKGLAFKMKKRPFFDHAKLVMDVRRPYSTLTPIGKDSAITGEFDLFDVRLVDQAGNVVDERKNACDYFPGNGRLFRWDDLDMAYFANYAFWNYFTLPNLLLNENIKWTELEFGLLQAEFPDSIPSHCKIQKFYFDTISGLLIRHDYTVDIFGKWAKVGNVVVEHSEFNGIPGDKRRKVTPRATKKRLLKIPVMIDITVHDCTYVY